MNNSLTAPWQHLCLFLNQQVVQANFYLVPVESIVNINIPQNSAIFQKPFLLHSDFPTSKGDITLGAEEITNGRLHFPVCEVCLGSRGSFEILKMGIASTPWSLPQRLAFFRLAFCFEPDSMSITGTSPLVIII